LRGTSGAGRSNEHDLWGSTGSSIAESNTQHSGQVVGHILLYLIIAVVFIYELVEGSVYFELVDFPFSVQSLSSVLELLSADVLVDLVNVVADAAH